MINKNGYMRSDMAEECCDGIDLAENDRGLRLKEYEIRGISVTRLDVTSKEGSEAIGKDIGSYITVNIGKIWLADEDGFNSAAEILAEELKKMALSLAPKLDSILVAGLGNRYITSDSIGPLAVKGLNVTGHIKRLDPSLFDELSVLSVSAIAPGVVGQTGIETAELIHGAAKCCSPSLILAIDALAAKSIDRLAVTVQISDTGIAPGSGIGNTRTSIDKNSLGVPVISIGVPTVVDSSTLIYDMLNKAGITDIPDEMTAVLENGKSFFVTLKDADSAARETARLISRAMNLAFSLDL